MSRKYMIRRILKATVDNYIERLKNRTNYSMKLIKQGAEIQKRNYKGYLNNQSDERIIQEYAFWFRGE